MRFITAPPLKCPNLNRNLSLHEITEGKQALKFDEIFQLQNKYIVTSKDDVLLIIDVKRAHERVLYEGYLNAGRGGESEVAQRLVVS